VNLPNVTIFHNFVSAFQYPDLKPPSSPTPPAAEGKTEAKAEAASTESPAEVTSAAVAEAIKESSPAKPRPLSPYANVSDT
jgi:hypothetical protein